MFDELFEEDVAFYNPTDVREIKGYEGLYSITRDGRVWSHSKLVKRGISQFLMKAKWKKSSLTEFGYLKVNLHKNNKYKTKKIHRLVGEAFIDNPENKPCINHKNGIKTDNDVDNLEWVTYKENDLHARKIGLINTLGNNNGMSKLNIEKRKLRKL